MNLYDHLVNTYNSLVSLFPPELQWAVTLAIMLLLIGFFIYLVKLNPLFGLLVVLLLIIFAPVFIDFIKNLIDFFFYLGHTLGTGTAMPPTVGH